MAHLEIDVQDDGNGTPQEVLRLGGEVISTDFELVAVGQVAPSWSGDAKPMTEVTMKLRVPSFATYPSNDQPTPDPEPDPVDEPDPAT